MVKLLPVIGLLVWLGGCGQDSFAPERLAEVYVDDFTSSAPQQCTTADLPLQHADAAEFFTRARVVDSKTLHDHYQLAPCQLEGSARYGEQRCNWQIQAGATGALKCGEQHWLFACDDCGALFAPTSNYAL